MDKNQQRRLGGTSQYKRKTRRVVCPRIQVKKIIPEGSDWLSYCDHREMKTEMAWTQESERSAVSASDESNVLVEASREEISREEMKEQLETQVFDTRERSGGASKVKGLF